MLLPRFCYADEQRVPAQERHDAHHQQVLDRLKHVEFEPEVDVQGEDRAQKEMEPERCQGMS